jgi:Zn-dependent protease with chaperone function
MGWKLAIAAALAEVLLLVPLLVYACIQLPALLADRIFPNLVLMVVIGGIYAVWRTVAALLKKTPLEFAEPMARELKPEDAPELWSAVREAAARLQTQPPDRILTGLQLNFYVTEMAVRYEGGRTEGRTLFMSYPLLKHLTVEEILAIVGHELGHFIGEDTRMTREFCPLRLKIRGTMLAMAGAGLAGRPSLHLLLFFDWLFSKTESAASRTRELLADQKAAALAGVETAARALVKFHIAAEAFGRGVRQAVESQKGDALEMPVREIIRDNLAGDAGFWKELFDHKAPHPMDSHPPLHDRLRALGQSIDPEQARAMGLEEGESAYSRWFAGRDELFAELKKTAEEAVGKMRAASLVKTANIATPEGRAILDRHFPELKWKDKTSLDFWLVTILLGVMLAPCAILVVVVDNAAARIVAGVILAFLGAVLAGFWMRHRRPELTLNAEGLFYSGWKRPLKFSDIAEIRFRRTSSGVVTLSFRLKTSQPSLWKFPVIPFRRKSAAFNISGLNVKAEEIAQKIFLYYQRLLPGEAPDEGKAE